MVKLNNPLMGTETATQALFAHRHLTFVVKLNNPLMGTETTLFVYANECAELEG